MVQLYGIKNCDSVKKAIRFFTQHNIPYTLHDFKTDPVSYDKIQQWSKQQPLKTLFNTRSTTYRTLKLKELDLSDEDRIKWMAKENLLIKRPILEYNTQLIVGFNQEIYTRTFL